MYAPLRTWLGLELLELVVSCAGFTILLHGIDVLQLYLSACRMCANNAFQHLAGIAQARAGWRDADLCVRHLPQKGMCSCVSLRAQGLYTLPKV